MIDFMTALAIILFIRSTFLIVYSTLSKRQCFCRKGSKVYRYYLNNINQWVYRIWGLSALWLTIKYLGD